MQSCTKRYQRIRHTSAIRLSIHSCFIFFSAILDFALFIIRKMMQKMAATTTQNGESSHGNTYLTALSKHIPKVLLCLLCLIGGGICLCFVLLVLGLPLICLFMFIGGPWMYYSSAVFTSDALYNKYHLEGIGVRSRVRKRWTKEGDGGQAHYFVEVEYNIGHDEESGTFYSRELEVPEFQYHWDNFDLVYLSSYPQSAIPYDDTPLSYDNDFSPSRMWGIRFSLLWTAFNYLFWSIIIFTCIDSRFIGAVILHVTVVLGWCIGFWSARYTHDKDLKEKLFGAKRHPPESAGGLLYGGKLVQTQTPSRADATFENYLIDSSPECSSSMVDGISPTESISTEEVSTPENLDTLDRSSSPVLLIDLGMILQDS